MLLSFKREISINTEYIEAIAIHWKANKMDIAMNSGETYLVQYDNAEEVQNAFHRISDAMNKDYPTAPPTDSYGG